MDIIKFSLENPVKLTVGVILAMLFGTIAYFATPVQLTPDVNEPQLTITTVWPGASAQEVEREIIEEQEEQLKSVEGMDEFKSESTDSMGTITMRFAVGTDLADARARVAEKLNQVPDYPDDAREPVISTVDGNATAIAWFILKPIPPTRDDLRNLIAQHPELEQPLAPLMEGDGPINLPKLNLLTDEYPVLTTFTLGRNNPALMRKFAEDYIEAAFERVPGIANGNVFGGQEQEFRVEVNPTRLAAFGVTIEQLRAALQAQNQNTSAGDIPEGRQRNVVRTLGQFQTAEQVEETIIVNRDNSPIRVRDVATVGVAYKKPDGVVRQMGLNALAINAQQAPNTNVKTVMGPPREDLDLNGDGEITALELADCLRIYGNNLRIACEELNLGILATKGLYLEQVYDQTVYLDSASELVESNVYSGGLLAVVILLLFLRSVRTVLIIGLSIPISVIATFIFVKMFGRSINVISLAGMAFAVGMVADNAITVLENIYRHFQMGKSPREAALKGTQEVWGAVLAATLAMIVVFVPVIFVQGQAGQLFRDISIAIACSVGISMLVSVTVIPAAACWLLQDSRNANLEYNTSYGASGLFGLVRLCHWINETFAYAMRKIMSARGSWLWRSLVVLVFCAGSVWSSFLLWPATEYLPTGNRNLVFAILLPPPGYNIDKMIEVGENIERRLTPYWAEEGQPGAPRIRDFFFVARGRMLFLGAKAVDELRAGELIPILAQAAAAEPGVIPIVSQSSLFDTGLSGGRTIDIDITGPDLEGLVEEAQKAFGLCMVQFPMDKGNQLRPIPGLDISSPELHVIPKLEKAAELGVTSSALGYAVNALVDGAFAGDYWHEGRRIDLVISGEADYTTHSHDLETLPIRTPSGETVALSSVAEVILSRGPEQVNHIERLRSITIQLKPAPGIPLEAAMKTVDEKVRLVMMQSPRFQSGLYQVRLAGTADKLADTWFDLKWNLLLALLLTYLLMAALFESFLYPLVVMISVALALVGGLGGLKIMNQFVFQPLDMLTMLGFVILIGTVVNNAILIVHQGLNYMREEGMNSVDAVCETVRTRMRPIVMSTLSTVLGMLPLVVPIPIWADGAWVWSVGAGSELYQGLGAVVLAGMIVSTVFTLVLIPAGFSLVMDAQVTMSRLIVRTKSALVRSKVAPSGTQSV
jgi:HAE1 family hydrophobic/amphiphilic exporter-1